jgi:hypothetical protein
VHTIIKSMLVLVLLWLPVVAVGVVGDVLETVEQQHSAHTSNPRGETDTAATAEPSAASISDAALTPSVGPTAPALPEAAPAAPDVADAPHVCGAADPVGETASVSAVVAGNGAISGTSSEDLALFAEAYNRLRADNCLDPLPLANFRYDACLEARLIWMAEDPSSDPASAWGHVGSVRSDGVASVGCDGLLAGGEGDSASTAAKKWWGTAANREVLYRPDVPGETDVCIGFAITHGGVPNEPLSFTRAAALRGAC